MALEEAGVRNVHGIIAVPPISLYLPSPVGIKTEAPDQLKGSLSAK